MSEWFAEEEARLIANAPPPDDGPSVLDKIAVLQRVLGFTQYRLKVDALRRPDGENISKSMRDCIDELFDEVNK